MLWIEHEEWWNYHRSSRDVSEGREGRNLKKGVPYKGDGPRKGRWVGLGSSLGGSPCYTNPVTNEGIATTYIHIHTNKRTHFTHSTLKMEAARTSETWVTSPDPQDVITKELI
jgi:hypothetical protein